MGGAGYFVQFTESTQPSHTSTTTQAPTDMDTADSASVSTGTTQKPAKVRCTHDVHSAFVPTFFCDVSHDAIRLVGDACFNVLCAKSLTHLAATSRSIRLLLGEALEKLRDDVETMRRMSRKMRPWAEPISTLPVETLLAWRSSYTMLAKEAVVLSKVIRAGSLQKILHLRMEHARMGDSNLSVLLRSLGKKCTPDLCVLSLRGNAIGPAGMEALSDAISRGVFERLQGLDLAENQLRNGGVETFCATLTAGSLGVLRQLNLEYNKIGDAGMKRLAASLFVGAMASPLDIMIGENPGHTRILEETASARSMVLHIEPIPRRSLR